MTKFLLVRWLSLAIVYCSSYIVHSVLFISFPSLLRAQSLPAANPPSGKFLVDTIKIGRPFRYSLVCDHAPAIDLLFPDTARHFAPFIVKDIAVFTTQTNGIGPQAISRDSAVYTLLSFTIDSIQTLQLPIRFINPADCTMLFTNVDTVFLQSALPASAADSRPPVSYSLISATTITPLRQQFNYPVLVTVLLALLAVVMLIYGLFGRVVRRQWQLHRLGQRHTRFLRDYDRLILGINAESATDTANQAIVTWKTYLERLDRQPYASLTTSEITERMNDERVTQALREADRMIYGGGFSAQSQPALRTLSEVATQTYLRRREELKALPATESGMSLPVEETETSLFSD